MTVRNSNAEMAMEGPDTGASSGKGNIYSLTLGEAPWVKLHSQRWVSPDTCLLFSQCRTTPVMSLHGAYVQHWHSGLTSGTGVPYGTFTTLSPDNALVSLVLAVQSLRSIGLGPDSA